MNRTCVLAMSLLFVGLAHSLSFDWVTYDPVHERVLFADHDNPNVSISSFDLSTRKIKPIVTRKIEDIRSLEYDPVTQLLFWEQGPYSICSLSLKPASSNKSVDGNVLVTLNHSCGDIAVDSCGGFCCKNGYFEERFEVNACYMFCLNNGVCSLNEAEKLVCQCTAEYQGERCDVSICKDYCLQGKCSVGTEGQPNCRCNAGYSGERCEVNECHGYCLNNGDCSLNEEDEPFCQCTEDYEGGRCDVCDV